MSKLRDAAQQALEALEQLQGGCTDHNDGTVEAITVWCPEVIDALRAALAEQPAGSDAEPVAWRWLYNGSPDSEKCFPMPGPDADVIAKAGASTFPRTVQYLYTAPQPAIPPGYKLVPEVPTNEWINNLAKTQTGPLEDVPFADIYQCIAELLDTAPEAPQPAKREPLTDAEIGQVRWQCRWNRMSTDDNVVYATTQQLDAFARAVIAAHERKNGIGGQA